VLAAVALTLGTAACGPAAAQTTSQPSATTTEAPVVGALDTLDTHPAPADPAPAPGPTDISPTYPTTAEVYAKAIVSAWTQDQPTPTAIC
jgi:hypothetical protein